MSSGEETKVTEVSYFLEILALNKHNVFGDATYHINKSRQEKLRLPSWMPEEEDLQKLRNFTMSEISQKTKEFIHIGQHEFIILRNAVCSRLTLFNACRGGEPYNKSSKNYRLVGQEEVDK